jgi:hypothetical protein
METDAYLWPYQTMYFASRACAWHMKMVHFPTLYPVYKYQTPTGIWQKPWHNVCWKELCAQQPWNTIAEVWSHYLATTDLMLSLHTWVPFWCLPLPYSQFVSSRQNRSAKPRASCVWPVENCDKAMFSNDFQTPRDNLCIIAITSASLIQEVLINQIFVGIQQRDLAAQPWQCKAWICQNINESPTTSISMLLISWRQMSHSNLSLDIQCHKSEFSHLV